MPVTQIPVPVGIKSVQRGVISIPNGAATAAATVSEVNPAKSELRFLGGSGYGPSQTTEARVPRVALTNGTTVTANTVSNVSVITPVGWELTEYY